MKDAITKISKNPAAVALGKMGRGKPKKFSAEEIARRTERIKQVSRWKKDKKKTAI